jgi:IS1 family transposase
MLDICPEAIEQTVAVGRSLPSNSASRSKCARGPFGQNLHAALEPGSTKRQLKNTAKLKASATSGSPPKRQLLPVFEDDSSHQRVGKSSGEMAHVERFFGRLRQKLARQVKRTRAASESERMLHLTTKLFVKWYNEAVT